MEVLQNGLKNIAFYIYMTFSVVFNFVPRCFLLCRTQRFLRSLSSHLLFPSLNSCLDLTVTVSFTCLLFYVTGSPVCPSSVTHLSDLINEHGIYRTSCHNDYKTNYSILSVSLICPFSVPTSILWTNQVSPSLLPLLPLCGLLFPFSFIVWGWICVGQQCLDCTLRDHPAGYNHAEHFYSWADGQLYHKRNYRSKVWNHLLYWCFFFFPSVMAILTWTKTV